MGFGGPALTAGTLVAFALYIDRFFDPIRDLSQRYNTFQATMVSSERIFELLDTPVEVRDDPERRRAAAHPRRRVGSTTSLSATSPTARPMLDRINLALQAGQTVALVGETGAGKSTLVRLVSRFYDATEGAVRVDGHDVRTRHAEFAAPPNGHRAARPVLILGQRRRQHPLWRAGRDPIAPCRPLLRPLARTISSPALSRGYGTPVGEGGAILSGGQRQLISFARALLADPRILILDEATSSVDTQTERVIQTALQRLLQGRTAFVIAHRLSTITQANLIVVMDHGRIIETGTHTGLLDQRGRYYELYTMAFADRAAPEQ